MPLPVVFLGLAAAASFLAGSQDEERKSSRRERLGLGRRRPTDKPYRFETDCFSSDGQSINDMRDRSSDVTYETMLRRCDLISWAVEHGYERSSREGHGLTLKDDWHVSYHRSVYQGKPCYYLVWSGIEFVWVEDDDG